MYEHQVLEQIQAAGVETVAILPCDRIKRLIPLVNQALPCIDLSREEVGVGVCAGVALVGRRPAMLIQSTGAGTLLNALCSLTVYYRLPLPLLISWRGHYKEGIEAQVPMGRAMPGVLKSAGIETTVVEKPSQIPRIGESIRSAYTHSQPVAILMSPSIFEATDAHNPAPAPAAPPLTARDFRHRAFSQTDKSVGCMTRLEAIQAMAPSLQDTAVVVNLGIPSKEWHAVADGPGVFYMLGSMGQAAAIGYGIARYTDKQVVVVDGDGSLLMTPNTLQHIAEHDRANLMVVALDNGVYGSTGNQSTATAACSIDLELLARVYGIRDTDWAADPDRLGIVLARSRRPRFLHVLTVAGNAPVANVAPSGLEIKRRFMAWLKGPYTFNPRGTDNDRSSN